MQKSQKLYDLEVRMDEASLRVEDVAELAAYVAELECIVKISDEDAHRQLRRLRNYVLRIEAEAKAEFEAQCAKEQVDPNVWRAPDSAW